jgi:hypothetical protein
MSSVMARDWKINISVLKASFIETAALYEFLYNPLIDGQTLRCDEVKSCGHKI